MNILNRHGIDIAWEAAGDGPALLLSHGYSATRTMWRDQVASFSADHRVITWDMRGHGDSASPADPAAYSESHSVDDMCALLDAAGVERALVGGLSLGGYMSLAFWCAYPERVRALLLFDTGPGYRKDSAREGWNRMAQARAQQLETEGLAALGAGAEVRIAAHRSAAGLAHAARGMLAQRDAHVMNALSTIDVPTLVLVGALDEPFLAASEYMARTIPGAQYVVLPGAGHATNIDQPAAFDAAVRAFVATLA